MVYAGENITDMPRPKCYIFSFKLADTVQEGVVTLVGSVIRLHYIPPFSSPLLGLSLSLFKSPNITMPCF